MKKIGKIIAAAAAAAAIITAFIVIARLVCSEKNKYFAVSRKLIDI